MRRTAGTLTSTGGSDGRRLSLHDALPISPLRAPVIVLEMGERRAGLVVDGMLGQHEIVVKGFDAPQGTLPVFSGATDRKSTRLNSSHGYISYAVFCLKKKKPKPHDASLFS